MLALLLRRPQYRRLFLASTISQVGDWLTLVAVSLLAEDTARGPFALGLMYAAHALPQALAAPFAGPIADRFDRRNVLIFAQIVQALLTVAMAIAAAFGSVSAVTIFVLVRSGTSALVVPAETAALRNLVARDELLSANTLVAATWSVAYVVGMALGGLLATLGPVPAIALDALSFVISGLVFATLPNLPPPPREADAYSALAALRDMGSALRLAVISPAVRVAILGKTPLALAGGAGWLALNVVAHDAHPFRDAALSLGAIQVLRGVGTGVGPALALRFVRAGGSAVIAGHGAMVLGLASMTAFVLVDPAAPAPLVLIALLWGAGSGANWVLASASLQGVAPDAMIGRLVSLDELLVTVGMVVGVVIAGGLVEVGVPLRVIVPSAVAIAAAAWTARSFDARQVAIALLLRDDRQSGRGDHVSARLHRDRRHHRHVATVGFGRADDPRANQGAARRHLARRLRGRRVSVGLTGAHRRSRADERRRDGDGPRSRMRR